MKDVVNIIYYIIIHISFDMMENKTRKDYNVVERREKC
jgi:hypothetical protein